MNSKVERNLFLDQKENITFRDVSLVEGKSIVSSRSEVDLEVELPKGKSLSFPVMTASMDTITSPEMAKAFLKMGGAIVNHRYSSAGERISLLEEGEKFREDDSGLNGVAVGYRDTKSDIEKFIEAGADLVSLDLAHAWHENTANWIKKRKNLFENTLLMIGNFSHTHGIKWLHERVGDIVDIVKVSQGGGSACTTREKAGIGKPTLQAVMDYTKEKTTSELNYRVVADGGIRHPGDIAKSIGAGACAGMIGGMISGTSECPGKVIEEDGRKYKEYRGMASKEAKSEGGVNTNHIEGVSTKVPFKGSVEDILKDIQDGLKSSISTCGFDHISDFQREAKFIRLSRSSQIESTPHKLRSNS